MTVDLPKQFIVCKTETPIPDGWARRRFGDFNIGRSASIGLVELVDDAGKAQALVIGWPVYQARLLITPEGPKEITLSATVDDFLYYASGRFLVLRHGENGLSAIPDASGFLGAVYCPGQDILASTTTLIPSSPETQDDMEITGVLRVGEKAGYYPFGYTNRQNISRLMPNTILDLQSYKTTRWDYIDRKQYGAGNIDDLIPKISKGIKDNVEAIASTGKAGLHLTAGHDSRMMLAAACDCIDTIEVQTIDFDYYVAKLDVRLSP